MVSPVTPSLTRDKKAPEVPDVSPMEAVQNQKGCGLATCLPCEGGDGYVMLIPDPLSVEIKGRASDFSLFCRTFCDGLEKIVVCRLWTSSWKLSVLVLIEGEVTGHYISFNYVHVFHTHLYYPFKCIYIGRMRLYYIITFIFESRKAYPFLFSLLWKFVDLSYRPNLNPVSSVFWKMIWSIPALLE